MYSKYIFQFFFNEYKYIMTKKYFLILPNQLFEDKYLNKEYNYIIWEHPHYFKSYNYNKKKSSIYCIIYINEKMQQTYKFIY